VLTCGPDLHVFGASCAVRVLPYESACIGVRLVRFPIDGFQISGGAECNGVPRAWSTRLLRVRISPVRRLQRPSV